MTDGEASSERQSTHQPKDSEFVLDGSVPQNIESGMFRLLRIVAMSMARVVIVGCVQAPVHRLLLLESVQGKLIQNGRLPHAGFGGIRGCVCRTIVKEGVWGLFRGCLVDMQLAVPTYIVQFLANISILWVQERLLSTSWWSAAAVMGIAAPGLRVLLSSPVKGCKNSILCNYAADIVAPKKVDVRCAENVEEAYLYNSAWEAAADVRKRCGWKGLCFKGVDVDIAAAYARGLTVQVVGAVILPKLNQLINSHASQSSGRRSAAIIATALGVRLLCGFVLHPFHVIRVRMTLLPTNPSVKCTERRWFWHHAQEIIQRDGITALWAGYRVRCLQELCDILLNTMASR